MTSQHADDEATAARLPDPAVGAASADLQTTSSDPDELRRLLHLARERLAFYESFDRVVGENVRRAGELMLERSALRAQAAELAAEAERDRAAREAESGANRESYRRLLGDLNRDIDAVRRGLDGLIDRLRDAGASLAPDAVEGASAPPVPPVSTDAQPASASPAGADPRPSAGTAAYSGEGDAGQTLAQPVESGTKPPGDEAPVPAEWDAPQVIELIAHGVPRAADALALQRHLGALDRVLGVEAREFAEGMLRLQVMARSPIPAADIETWDEHPELQVLQHGARVIEIDWGTPPIS